MRLAARVIGFSLKGWWPTQTWLRDEETSPRTGDPEMENEPND